MICFENYLSSFLWDSNWTHKLEVRFRHTHIENSSYSHSPKNLPYSSFHPPSQALRETYRNAVVKKKNQQKLQLLKFFSFYVLPAILVFFTLGYFLVGLMH